MSPASIARISFVAAVTGIFFAGALIGAGGGCSLNTAGITDPGSGLQGIGGTGSENRGGIGGNISIMTGSGGAVRDASTGSGGATDGTGGSGSGGTNGAGGALSGSGGANDGAGGAIVTGAGGANDGAGGMQAGTGGANNGMGGAGMGGAPGIGGHGTGGAGTGGAGMGGMPGVGGMPGTGGAISVIGCADGTREAFVNVNNFPSIAGCAGGWSVAGVVSTASLTPACNRAAGNDGTRPNGNTCTVADLCAVGWHVCAGATELDSLNVTCAQAGIPAATNAAASQVLYATRQRGVTGTVCNANDMIRTNDVHGCGNVGLAEDRNCAPLNAQFSHTECDDLGPPWSCPGALTEGLTVVKSTSANGGVLCCK
jgi:hypothetical protein